MNIRILALLISASFNLLLAIFIWSKNFKKKINFYVGLTALTSGIYSFIHVLEQSHKSFVWAASTWWGLLIIPSFIGFTMYYKEEKPNVKIIFWLFLGAVIFALLGYSPLITKDIRIYPSYVKAVYGPLEPFARMYILSGLLYALYNLVAVYKKGGALKKLQTKYFLVGTSIYTLSGILGVGLLPFLVGDVLVEDIPCFFSIFWIGLTVFAIVRYRLMEIDTVIHRTIMWALTVLFLIIPVCWAISSSIVWFAEISPLWRVSILALVLLFFLGYYHKLKPRVDHLFRRRIYDYQYELIDIPSKIGTELELSVLVDRLFGQLEEVLYTENALLLVKFPEETVYREAGSIGYEVLSQKGILKEKEVVFPADSKLIQWLTHNPEALEKEHIEINPQYKDIKEEALSFFKANALEIVIPLVFEENLTGILGLGKKENLQAYRLKDLELLERLGTQISITIDNALHHKDIVEKQRLQEELRLGRELQISLLPTKIPRFPGVEVYGLMHPAKEIGGDYYDFILHKDENRPNGSLSVTIGDVSGKGLDAGIVMAMTKTIIFSLALQGQLSPRNILEKANEILYFHVNLKKFVTLLYLHILPEENKILYSSAGHERILIYRTGAPDIGIVKSGGLILGMVDNLSPYLEENTLVLNKGDKILLYTDGATEARNPQEELYGLPRLVESFQRHAHLSVKETIHNVHQDIKDFISTRDQYDDITLVGIEKE